MPISALTAWQGLAERARVAPGERVLVHGGAGAVGLCAVQLARRRGARVLATASAHHLDFVRGPGADEVIDHRARPCEEVARDVDVVFDTVGGETLARSFGVLRPGGRLVTIAASGEVAREPRVREARPAYEHEPTRGEITSSRSSGVGWVREAPCPSTS